MTVASARDTRMLTVLVGCRGEFVTDLGWLRCGDADDPLDNEVHSMTRSKLLPKFVHDLSLLHLDERETGGEGEGWWAL